MVPYFIENINIQGQKAIVKFEDMHHIDTAQTLVECALYLPLDNLPELPEGEFYYHQVIGYSIIDMQKGKLGTLNNIYEGNQDLIGMQYHGREVLIPMVDGIVLKADHEKKEIEVNLPEGLLEIYLEDNNDVDDEEIS